jgi:hypothetical protein
MLQDLRCGREAMTLLLRAGQHQARGVRVSQR